MMKVWDKKEMEMLKKLAEEERKSSKEVAEILGRTRKAVQKRASDNGIRFFKENVIGDAEKKFIVENFDKISRYEMAKRLGVKYETLNYHCRKMGLTSANNRYVNTVKEFAGKKSAKEIAEKLSIPEQTARGIACENNVSLRFTRKEWTKEEDNYLLANYPQKGVKALARGLNTKRSVSTVKTRLKVLGIYRGQEAADERKR